MCFGANLRPGLLGFLHDYQNQAETAGVFLYYLSEHPERFASFVVHFELS